MRLWCATALASIALAGVAGAQPRAVVAPPPDTSRGYAEVVVQSSFGNVTSQSFGGEIGVTIVEGVSVFVDGGHVRDTAPAELGSGAGLMAAFISRTQSNVTYRAKQPVSFGVAGIRYQIPTSSRIAPYVMFGGGAARVEKNVTFAVAGTDVTGSLSQYGVVLGTDLAGTETKGMISAGAGVAWSALRHLVIDLQYRYGRVMTTRQAMNLGRAGIGIGARF
jgi:opacity protein-like surface antigen